MNLILQAIKSLFRKLEAKIPKKLSDLENDLVSTPDWNQNDPEGDGYIENRPFYKEENIEELIFDGEVHFDENGIYRFDSQINLIDGKNYTIVFDGHVYNGVAYYDDIDYDNVIYIQTVLGDSVSIYSYYMYCADNYHNASKYLKIFIGSLRVAKKIDAMFIPEDIRKMSAFNPYGNGSFSMNVSSSADIGEYSHTEGFYSLASGDYSHAEGHSTVAPGQSSHAEGSYTFSSGISSHAEGNATDAYGNYSHAEGYNTIARAKSQSVSGEFNIPEDDYISTETKLEKNERLCSSSDRNNIYYCDGYTFDKSTGLYTLVPVEFTSVSNGLPSSLYSRYLIYGDKSGTTMYYGSGYSQGDSIYIYRNSNKHTSAPSATVRGKYAHIVGNGTRTNNRSNAHTLDWNGLGWFAGGLKVGGTGQDDEAAAEVALKTDIPSTIVQSINGIGPDENGNVAVDITKNVHNVLNYGAKGDGVTDDTAAIADAISALPVGGTLYFPEGVYRVSNINLKSDMTVQGDGWCSVIQLLDSAHMITGVEDYSNRNNCLNIEGKRDEPIRNIIIRDIKLDGTRPTQASGAHAQDGRLDGIHIRFASDIHVENVWMYNNGYHGCIMTYATNVVFEHCKATDNGFRPIHGHTKIYNCRLSNCVCENNGLGLTGGSGYENDSIFFFGAQNLVINDNIIKSNRRGCITVGCDQYTTAVEDHIPSRNITISGNVCECYADLPYIPTENSDTGVAKFSSMGILVYGGDAVLENVTVTGNTITNAHEAIRLYAQENNVCSLNAIISGNAVIDCSYGIWAVEVENVTISSNQFQNLACSWMYAQECRNLRIQGNNVKAPGTSEYRMCRISKSNDVVIQNNNLGGDCANAIYAPDSNTNVIVMNNVLYGFTDAAPIVNINGKTVGNIYITAESSVEKVCIDPYSNPGFVRPTLVNPNTTSTNYCYTTPVEITELDEKYELNTFFSVPNSYTNPSEYNYSSVNIGIVFLAGMELSNAVGIVHPSNNNGIVTFSDTCITGTSSNVWGIQFSITAEKVKELFPTATHVMMEIQKVYSDTDSLGSAYRNLNDGHAYVYRTSNGKSIIKIDGGMVKTVNGKAPDENGNVEITIPESGTGASVVVSETAPEDTSVLWVDTSDNKVPDLNIPSDDHINDLINAALGVIENGSY